MLEIVFTLLPIVLLVAIGAGLFKTGFLKPEFRKGLDNLVYYVALPVLIVIKIAGATSMGGTGQMIAVFCLGTVFVTVLAYVLAWVVRLPRSTWGVFVQASFRGNLAFVGIPVIVLATVTDDPAASNAIQSKAFVVFAPAVILYNVLGVAGLSLAQQKFDAGAPVRLLKSMATNPLLLACGVGLVLLWLKVDVPKPLTRTMEMLGSTAGPLALLSLGGAVVAYKVHEQLVASALSSAIKLVALPAIVLGLAWMMGLDGDQRKIVLILAATPTAVASYVLAIQLKGDPGLAASTIVISTLLSVLSLAGALALA